MIRTIIIKELLNNFRSSRFIFTYILSMVIIMVTIFTGILRFHVDQKNYTETNELHKKNLENLQSYNMLGVMGMKISKAPEPLAILVNGISNNIGQVAKVTIAFDPELIEPRSASNPALTIFEDIDLCYVLQVILSLIAILFAYDSIVGERENNTLKLLMSNSISREKIIVGKTLGGLISLILPLLIPFLLMFILFALFPSLNFQMEDWGRIMIILILFILYISIFFNLSLFVSSLATKSSNSLMILIFVWIVFIVLVPKISSITGQYINEIPSIHEINAEKNSFVQETQQSVYTYIEEWNEDKLALRDESPEEYQNQMNEFLENLQQKLTQQIDERNKKIEEKYSEQKNAQWSLVANSARISPSVTFKLAAMRIARTGVHEYEHYLSALRSYKPIYTRWINRKLSQKRQNLSYELDLSDMPTFVYEPEKFGVSFKGVSTDIIILFLSSVLLFVAAYTSFLRREI